MRIIVIFILLVIIGILPIHAQIQTFDIKRTPSGEEPGGYGGFQQISPTRILVMAGNYNEKPYLLALNRDGTIEHQWRAPFLVDRSSMFYHFDKQSNTVVYLCSEYLPNNIVPSQIRLRLVLLDSNLIMKSNIVLDSVVPGTQTILNYNTRFQGVVLLDSSILLMSYNYASPKAEEQITLHLSREGNIIRRTTVIDTSGTAYNIHYPLFQMPSGEIVFKSRKNNTKNKSSISSIRTSDTSFNFSIKPIIDSLPYGSISKFIFTKDGGIAFAYYETIFEAFVVKYDKNFKKQWTTKVPGNGDHQILSLIESKNGGYYIATTAIDTMPIHNYPQFKETYPGCFEDIVLSKIDTSGRVLFSANYGSELCEEDFEDMMEDYIDGGVIISGSYNLPTPLGGCDEVSFACGNNPYTEWLFKVDTLGQPAKRITGVHEEIGRANDIFLFPNPVSGILTVEFGKGDYFTSVEIIDLNGHIFKILPLEHNIDKINIDISTLSSGNYYCRLKARSYFTARPFTVQK